MAVVAGKAKKNSVFFPTFEATRSVTQRIEEWAARCGRFQF